MKKEMPVKYQVLLFLVLFLPVVIISVKNKKTDEDNLKKRGRYVVGKTERWGYNPRSSGYFIHYNYSYNKTIFSESIGVSRISDITTNGGVYMVIFDPENPRNSKMLFDKEVCNCNSAPNCGYIDTGWITIPGYIKICDEDAVK